MFKAVQEPWELDMMQAVGINQGQLLSIPFVIIGVMGLLGVYRRFGDAAAQQA